MCGGEDNTTSMSLKRQAPISLHVFRVEPFHYTCEDIVTSELQEVGSHGPCLAYFSSFITALSGPPDDDADKIAANSLAQMHPMIEDGHNYNLWVALFYGCKLRNSNDTVIQRIYRLGLVQCARILKQKGIYGLGHYLHAIAPNGDNLMHLAVRSGNPELANILGETLHEYCVLLLKGSHALNSEGLTPKTLAKSLKLFGTIDAIQNLLTAYSFHTAPSFPPPPKEPSMPTIQLIKPDVQIAEPLLTSSSEPSKGDALEKPDLIQRDASHVRFANASFRKRLSVVACYVIFGFHLNFFLLQYIA